MAIFSAYTSDILKDVDPTKFMEPQDHTEVIMAQAHINGDLDTVTLAELVKIFEKMHAKYPHLPYFTARLADLFHLMNAGALAAGYYRQAQRDLDELGGDKDEVLDNLVLQLGLYAIDQAMKDEVSAKRAPYYQTWKTSSLHEYPSSPQMYLRKLAIESNQLENIFLLTEESIQDLVYAVRPMVQYNYSARITRQIRMKSSKSLKTLSAYEIVRQVAEHQQVVSKDLLYLVHRQLMSTCRFVNSNRYIASGVTRNEMKKATVIVGGEHPIQLCPYANVDMEIAYICREINSMDTDDDVLIRTPTQPTHATARSFRPMFYFAPGYPDNRSPNGHEHTTGGLFTGGEDGSG